MIVNHKTQRLPDSFAKADSNNNLLLSLDNELMAEVNNAIVEIYNSLDLYQATGNTLDLYGEVVGQKRGNLTDTQYRLMILSKIARNNAGVDYNSIISVLALILSCEPSDISLLNGKKTATVAINRIPLDTLNEAGFTAQQAMEMLNSLLPITITIEGATFEGTFSFSSCEDVEIDELKGFSDDEQSTGGYFGYLLNENEIVLPT